MLTSTDHQILYGRRGTGKTHALLYLSDLAERAGDVAVYVDLRTIGSAGSRYADSALSSAMRGTHLLVDALEAIHEELLAVAAEREVADEEGLQNALDMLVEAATAVEVVGRVEHETKIAGATESSGAFGLSTSAAPSVTASTSHRHSATAEEKLRRSGIERHHVLFGPLTRALRSVTQALDPIHLWLLLDEWSSIPLDLQPLLADLLRRSILPVPGITVKIAAIERRSRFFQPVAGDYLGIEVGSDAASAVSLDDVMVSGRANGHAHHFFGQLFYKHAAANPAWMILNPPSDTDSFLAMAFQRDAFAELVRAAEGIPRDAINIAALAAQYAHLEPIDLADIRRAARDWYLRDKQAAIKTNQAAQLMLQLLVDEVVGRRRSRTFILDQTTGARHDIIDELCDARLLHMLHRGIVDRHNPGRLYDGFAIDYGCYVALLLADDSHYGPRDRGGWLNSPDGVPPDGFIPAKAIIDLAALGV